MKAFMKEGVLVLSVLLFAVSRVAGQSVVTKDEFVNATIDASGELHITASPTSAATDFDYLLGKWKMHHRRLNKRLEGCTEWTEFDSFDENHTILGGVGDIDALTTNELPGMGVNILRGLRYVCLTRRRGFGVCIGCQVLRV